MFAPVVCSRCRKSFQVPAAAVGKAAVCPWCQEAVATVAPAAAPEPTPAADPPPRPGRGRGVGKLALLAVVCVAVGAGTFAASRYGSGRVPDAAWVEFAPPDGDCRVKLPGTPDAEPVPANPLSPALGKGQRYVVRRRFDGVTAAVGWIDVDKDRAGLVRAEDLIAAERQRRAAELGGVAAAEDAVRYNQHLGARVTYNTPNGPAVDWLLAALDRPRPRLFVLSAAGPGVTADGPLARRLFDSFRLEHK